MRLKISFKILVLLKCYLHVIMTIVPFTHTKYYYLFLSVIVGIQSEEIF